MAPPLLHRLERPDGVFGYCFEDHGRIHLVVRGHMLPALGRPCFSERIERWFVVAEDTRELCGHGLDGYTSLREVREAVAAVLTDRGNGVDVHWSSPAPPASPPVRPVRLGIAQALARRAAHAP